MATAGPLREKGGFDQVLQCLTGMAVFQGGGPDKPQLVLGSVLDYFTSALLAYGVAAALFHRERSGTGQYLSLSLLRSALTIQAGRFVWADSEGRDVAARFRHRRADRHPSDKGRRALYFGALQPFLRRAVRVDRTAGTGAATRAAPRCAAAPRTPPSWCRRCAPRSPPAALANGRRFSASACRAPRYGRSKTCSITRKSSPKSW